LKKGTGPFFSAYPGMPLHSLFFILRSSFVRAMKNEERRMKNEELWPTILNS
jgi:hypothetical protein